MVNENITIEEAMEMVTNGVLEVEVPSGADAMTRRGLRNRNQLANEEAFIQGWLTEHGDEFNREQIVAMFNVAWERGHSAGWNEVLMEMEEIVNLTRLVINLD